MNKNKNKISPSNLINKLQLFFFLKLKKWFMARKIPCTFKFLRGIFKDIKLTDQHGSKAILVFGALVYTFYHLLWSKN